MHANKRTTNRVAALVQAPLHPEVLVPELAIALQRAIGTDGALPVVLVTTPSTEPPHAFRVWRGSETNTDELRGLLQLGVWPGPSSLPSLQRMLSERLPRRVYAAPLWGDGSNEDGPWVALWRDRHVRHGYYLTAFSDAGRAVVVLLSRKPESAGFTNADVELGESVTRFFVEAAERKRVVDNVCTLIANEVPIAFDGGGKLASLGLGGPDLLRDLAGGGVGARAEGRGLVEAVARRYHDSVLARPGPVDAVWSVAEKEDAAFMRSHFALMVDGRAREPRIEPIGENQFGSFELRLTASNDVESGAVQVLGTLRRLIPRTLAVVRALIEAEAPGREIELALHLCSERSFAEVAAAMHIGPASAKTLQVRLGQRFEVSGRERLVATMIEHGRTVTR